MNATAQIAVVRKQLAGEPVFLTGSLVAEQTYGKFNAHSDIDLFCGTPQTLMTTGQKLLCSGYTLDDRFKRVWFRWQRYGFKQWHTNSLRLQSPAGTETNLIYKLVDGHPSTSLAQVLESFDFGLLATGWELETDTFRDMRSYLFPGMDPDGPLPLMPNKRANWRQGFISQYNGLRECGRYAKYFKRGYDMSLVKDDLVTGYWMAADYLTKHFESDKQTLGRIYETIGMHIDVGNVDQLELAAKQIDYKDSLDTIMEALE